MPYLTSSIFLWVKDFISPVSMIVVVVNENGNLVVHNHYLHKIEIRSEILTWYVLVIWNESLLSYCPYCTCSVTGRMVWMVDTKLEYRILQETHWVCSHPKPWGLSCDRFLKPFNVITSHLTRVYYCHVLSACGVGGKKLHHMIASSDNVINIRPHFFDVATKILRCLLFCQFC